MGALLPSEARQTMPALTDADDIELEAFYNDAYKQDWAEPADHLEIDRWSKYGHDRLYINDGIAKADKYDLYVDLQTHEIVSNNEAKHSGGTVEITGDTATITIEVSGGKYEHEITVSLSGEAFAAGDEADGETADEETTNGENTDEPEVVTDGGTDTEPVEGVLEGGINKVIVRTLSHGYRFMKGGGDDDVTHVYYGTVENDQEIPIGEVPSNVFDALEDAGYSPNRETTPHPAGRDIRLADSDSGDETDDDGGSESIPDGGEIVTAHATDYVDDAIIEDALAQHGDPDHPEALTVDDVRELLAHVQHNVEAVWGEWLDSIERTDTFVVAQDDDVVVLDTGERDAVCRALEAYDGPVTVDDTAERVVSSVHHRVAEQIDREYSWGVTYPLVVRLPADGEAGQRFVEAAVNGLQRRGLAPGQAWAYYGVAIRGESRNAWGARKGDADHKNVSDALDKATQTLPEA